MGWGGHGNPLWNSCLENAMVTGAWWATVHRVAKSWTWLRRFRCTILVVATGSSLHRVQHADSNCGVAQWHLGSLVLVHGLICSTACGIFVPKPGIDRTCTPCILRWILFFFFFFARWILNHWTTTREVSTFLRFLHLHFSMHVISFRPLHVSREN